MALLPSVLEFHRNQTDLLRRHCSVVFLLLLLVSITGIALPFVRTANSDAAKLAFTTASESPAAIRSLGSPLERSSLVFGDFVTYGSRHAVSFSFAMLGPHGRGMLFADAVQLDHGWQLLSLDLVLPDQAGRLNLLPIQSTVPR